MRTETRARAAGPRAAGAASPFGRACPIGLIDADPAKNARRVAPSEAEVLALGESLKAGQLQPCLGRLKPDGRVELWVGFTRYEAAKRVGLETLWVEEHRGAEAERAIVNLLENVARKNLTPAEKARAYHNLHLQMSGDGARRIGPHKVDETIAARCGVSRSEVTQYRILAECLCGKLYRAWLDLGPDLPVKWLWDIRKLDDAQQVRALEDRLRRLEADLDPDPDEGAEGDGEADAAEARAERARREPATPRGGDRRPGLKQLLATYSNLCGDGAGGLVDRATNFTVAPSGQLTVDWLAGARYALEYALGSREFDPAGGSAPEGEEEAAVPERLAPRTRARADAAT